MSEEYDPYMFEDPRPLLKSLEEESELSLQQLMGLIEEATDKMIMYDSNTKRFFLDQYSWDLEKRLKKKYCLDVNKYAPWQGKYRKERSGFAYYTEEYVGLIQDIYPTKESYLGYLDRKLTRNLECEGLVLGPKTYKEIVDGLADSLNQ